MTLLQGWKGQRCGRIWISIPASKDTSRGPWSLQPNEDNQICPYGQIFRQWWTLLQIISPSLKQNKHFWRVHLCFRVMIYLNCVMSNNYDLLQNKSLRNRLIIAASVMEFISTTAKKKLVEKILLKNQPKTKFHNMWKILTMIGTSLTKI